MGRLLGPFVGYCCVIPGASALRLPFVAPIPPWPCCTSSPGRDFAGIVRSPFTRHALLWASAPSGNGVRLPLLDPPLACWGCSVWWSSWHTPCTPTTYRRGQRPGLLKPNPLVSLPLLRFVAICGSSAIRQ